MLRTSAMYERVEEVWFWLGVGATELCANVGCVGLEQKSAFVSLCQHKLVMVTGRI